MEPLKSSGLDGFGAGFYQKHWNTVGSDISEAVLNLLNDDGMTSTLNSTYIALILKKLVESVCDFRPLVFVMLFISLHLSLL